jgi:hypothetical protein
MVLKMQVIQFKKFRMDKEHKNHKEPTKEKKIGYNRYI